MYKWIIMAASCLAFSAVSAQETNEPVSSSEEVVVDEGSGSVEVKQPPSLFDCGCNKGKPK